jgi:hypothetical protein
MVAGYRCSVFGIAVVDATVRTNVVIAPAPFTGAFGQRKFIYPDHATASKLPHRENHNAPGRRPEAAALLHPPNGWLSLVFSHYGYWRIHY